MDFDEHMRFSRYPKFQDLPASPRQIAHARRRVEKDREECGLFPQLMKHKTAEDRIEAMQHERSLLSKSMRDTIAKKWREARLRLRQMPESKRMAILRYWSIGHIPGNPYYLSGCITDSERGVCYWHKLADLRRLTLIAMRQRVPGC